MFREYENARSIEAQIRALKEEMRNTDDADRQISLHETIEELQDRANHAWQDEEGEWA